MSVVILRRRKLGRTSAKEIAKNIPDCKVIINDRNIPVGRDGDVLIRWGCTSKVEGNYSIINSADAIHQVNDKTAFRRLLNDAGLCPRTWFSLEEADHDDEGIPNPPSVVVRPRQHAQGKNLYKCDTWDEIYAAVRRCGEGFYISKYIDKVAEYRVAVAQGRAVWVVKKTPGNPEDIAWNVAQGGRFDNVKWNDWPLKVVKTAIAAFNLSSLDFGGVDLMVDADNNCYVLEINSAPSLTSPYRQSCMAKVFSHMVENGKERIPLVTAKGGYSKFIHPALTDKELLVDV
jgi:glutathione synthase/RimK-type ligase-like ATP-grasp enzyme